MSEDSSASIASDSIARIEAALARLEAAARQASGENDALENRHERLKSRVAGSLAELEAVIAAQEKP